MSQTPVTVSEIMYDEKDEKMSQQTPSTISESMHTGLLKESDIRDTNHFFENMDEDRKKYRDQKSKKFAKKQKAARNK